MAFSHSHKTVIVLDHSPASLKSSKKHVEFDLFSKSRGQGVIPLAPIPKSFWTCNVEATVEYARIIYDIFPRNKLLRILACDQTSTSLNSWEQSEQNLQFLMTNLAKHGAPTKKMSADDCNVMHGLSQAVEVLCELSATQHQIRTDLSESAPRLVNRGRIICLTSIKNENYAQMLEECLGDAVVQHNKLAAATDYLMPIDHCELVLVHVVPVGYEGPITDKPLRVLTPLLSTEVHVSQSGGFIAAKMVDLAMNHYGLASTTVTGIPMKEEQNASSSANYDVELLHPAEAHVELIKSGAVEGLIAPSKEGLYADTVTLKWCTPKSNVVELHQCRGAYRMTPVDVNSRPSSCLTNFLLNGRAVMLEQPRKSGVKMISHMLASHGGEIYIHCMATTRSMLEDPPSISEGSGGRVTDYRINDFGEIMKETRLAPVADIPPTQQTPIDRAKALLERMTRLWPMTISDTIIFNMLSTIDPLPTLLVKEVMNDDDLLECKKCIYHIVDLESRNEALPVPAAGTRGKGPKRDEQYRQMWLELEKLVRAHSETSPNHEKVLACLLECKKPTEDSKASPKKSVPEKVPVKEEKVTEADQALKEHDRYMRMTEREKQELNNSDFRADPNKTSEPPLKKFKMEPGSKSGGPQSVLAMWTSRIQAVHNSRHAEFAGRLESKGNKAELYVSLKEELEEQDSKAGVSSSMNSKPLHKSASASNIRTQGANGAKLSSMAKPSPNTGQYKPSSSLKK